MADTIRKLRHTGLTLLAAPVGILASFVFAIGFVLFVVFLVIEDIWQ